MSAKPLQIAGRTLRLFHRDPAYALLLAKIALSTMTLTIAMMVLPLPSVVKLFSSEVKRRRRGIGPDDLARAVDSVLGLNWLVLTRTCWKRAIILHSYLSKYGIPSKLIFGVRKADGLSLDGHAWVEVAGEPILEAETPNFLVTLSYPEQ